jgi:hypothetical protein
MSTGTMEGRMAGRKKESFERGRIEFKASEEWTRRANEAAQRLGFGSLSALIRFAVTKYLDEAAPEPPAAGKPGKGKKGGA